MTFILSVVLAVLLLRLADVIFIGIIIGTMWISSKRLKVKQSPEKVNYPLGHHGLLLLLNDDRSLCLGIMANLLP